MAISKQQRKAAEELIYKYYDAVDRTKINSEHYKKLFANMSDSEFESLFKQDFPLKFHVKPWVVEPTMTDVKRGLTVLGVPMTEPIKMPFYYENENGEAVSSKNCDVLYLHIKKEQQFITKKNSMSTDIDKRDMRTGLLINFDKNGKTSDREHEAMITMGLTDTVSEFNTIRADSMNRKNMAYSIINSSGILYLKDVPDDPVDSLAKNMFNVYTIGSMIYTNILSDTYLLPHTTKDRKTPISRG